MREEYLISYFGKRWKWTDIWELISILDKLWRIFTFLLLFNKLYFATFIVFKMVQIIFIQLDLCGIEFYIPFSILYTYIIYTNALFTHYANKNMLTGSYFCDSYCMFWNVFYLVFSIHQFSLHLQLKFNRELTPSGFHKHYCIVCYHLHPST